MHKFLQKPSPGRWHTLARQLRKFSGCTALAGGLAMAGIFSAPEARAQAVANYLFAPSSGTYTSLGASATQLPASFIVDTGVSGAIPLGFTFNYAGVDYTTVYASSNGFLSFNPSITAETTNSPSGSASTSRPLIAPLWDDLAGSTTLGSSAAYETTGSPGSRVFTFEWSNWLWRYNATAPNISFQAKLYEATGKIEFVYRQENGSLSSSPTASIGITASATGSGNYLNLSDATAAPTTSSTTATTNIATKPATGQIYTFSKPATEIGAVALIEPIATGCYSSTQTVKVQFKNLGSAPIDFSVTPLTVTSAVTGTNPTTFPNVVINTGTLAVNATQDVVISTNYDMTASGAYTFNASASLQGDATAANNAIAATVRNVLPTATLPVNMDFTGFTGSNLATVFPNWKEATGATSPTGTTSSWSNRSNLGGTGNVSAYVNLSSNSKREWIVGPKITPTATSAVIFKAAVTAAGAITPNTSGGMAGSDDKVQVMVSTDCGSTFTPIYTIDQTSGLTNILTSQYVSLAQYAGQNIVVAFFATEGTVDDANNYDFHIDDVFIGTPAATLDLGATAFVNPVANGCYNASEQAIVTIRNFGSAPIDFSTTNATVSVRTHGTNPGVISIPVTTGILAPGATQNVTVGNLNMSAAGTYNFRAYTTIAGDTDASSDTTRATRTVLTTASLPQLVNFTGFTGSNLSTISPNWREGAGNTPAGTTSEWLNKADLGATGNITAKVNLYTNSRKEWIVGPKVVATATTELRFKAAITAYAGLSAHATGMQGTDDKVQVLISTNCGNTFTPLYTFDASTTANLTNVLTDFSFPLGTYAGQQIMIAFYATDGPIDDAPDYDFHLDDIFLGTPPNVDMGVEAFTTPVLTKCFTNAEPVEVTIKNFHASPIDFSVDNTVVSVKVTGPVNTTLTTTLNTGTLAPGATQTVTVGNINMTAPGNYNFKGYTAVMGDNITANDTARTVRTVYQAVALPQETNFTGFDGSNLNTLFPNWKEAAGVTPVLGTSNWVSTTGLGGTSNVTAKINLYTNTRNEWIMGPRIAATATTSLRFKAAITDYASTSADADGMQGTDDKVQVMVSTNCGETFTSVYTFDATTTANLTNVLTDQIIPLGNFAGQEIIVAFYATDGPTNDAPDYDFHIDDLYIGTVVPVDLQARALVSPVAFNGCFGATQNVSVRIRNFGTSPLDFTTNNATVTVNVTGAATQTLTATLNNNTINGGNPLAVEGEIVVPVGTLNMSTAGVYTFNVSATTIGDGNTANDAIPAVNITASPVVAGTASATNPNVCVGSTATLNLTGNTGGDIQWQQATSATGPFTDIAGATTPTFTTTTGINQPTYFQAVLSCGTSTQTSNVVTVNVIDPQVATSTPAARCGAGTVTLSATAAGAGTINWFNAATGGSVLATGNTYSPNVTATTTFYAEANEGGATTTIGKASTPGTDGTNTGGGLVFNALNPFVLNSVVVYTNLANGGNLIVNLKNSAGTTLQTTTFALPGVSGMTAVTVPLNFNVPAGTGMRLEQGSSLGLYRDYTSVPFPYSSPSTGVTITDGTLAGYYYFFYNWSVTTGCRSARTPVIATVNPIPLGNLPADLNVCGATSTVLDAGNAGATYQWFLNNAPITGATSQTLTVTANGNYKVNVTNATSCSGVDSVQVVFNTKPATPTVTAGGAITFCQGGSVVLTGASTTTGVTYSWLLNGNAITGATTATYTANAAGNYRVVATNATGCTDTSATTTVTVNPLPAKPTVTPAGTAAICQGSSVVLTGASTSTGVTYSWLLNGNAITGATAATYTANAAGNYRVVATNATGCTDTSTVTAVSISAAPVTPTITAGGPTTFCDGDSVMLTGATTTTGVTYQWLVNGNAVTGATTATFNAKAAGNYRVVVANASGCTDTSTVTAIALTPRPATPTITPSGDSGQELTSSAATGNQWYLNGTAITGATAQTYQTTANGNYTVVVTDNTTTCASLPSAAVNITNTGIKGAMAGMSVSVYPNPSNGKFNVKLVGYKHDAALELYTLTGQLIVKENVKAGQEATKLQVKNLAAGTYLLKVVSEKGVQINKLIVE
ncbi:T9SS type A sorting domain-containing protein [Adhaeribacter terreus]|uniref:T9SS type A sorting domain-containing protein n=1 Tax=Adhaeribacter terreus TaxID=529703 RepID=A0ABW0E7T8_9BACT